jgi:AraC-like DNA-binding protein
MLVIREPAADLATRIEMFWSVRGDGRSGTSFHEFFPDNSSNLVFRLSSSGCRLVLLGPVTDRAAVERDDRAEYFGVRFRTGHTPALADVRPSELTNAHVELTVLAGVRVDDLAERLSSRTDVASRQLILEDLLRRAPPLVRSVRAQQLAALIDAHGGRLRVDALAAMLGIHVRSLERLCLGELGMSPKRLTRLVRLRHVLTRLHAGGFGTLADLAHACGYSDQPHMIRDFKELTGRLPGERDAFRPRRLDAAPRTPVVHRYRGSDAEPSR